MKAVLRHRLRAALALTLGVAATRVLGGTPAVPASSRLSSAGAEEVWRSGVALIHEGRFDDATNKLAELASTNAAAERLSGWLAKWTAQSQLRSEMTLADFRKYVEWAQKRHAKEDFAKALDYATRALNNTDDREKFVREPWVGALIADATAKAAKLREEKLWLDALAIYHQAGQILEHDLEIRKQIRECRTHARLDAIYTEDSRWQERLVGIEPQMVEAAFRKIDQQYVEKVDWRPVTEAGLEQMLLLTESSSLQALFESLNDDMERQAFSTRIEANLGKVRNADRVGFKVAREQFRNALRINRQTVQLPQELVINEYMEGCLQELDDFTAMVWPSHIKEFEKHTRGDFVGVGIQIRQHYNPDLKDYEIVVVSPIEDTPAYRAGVQAGDVITKVDGEPILGNSLNKTVDIITGPRGTAVTLAVRRESEPDELAFVLVRDNIKIHSIKGFARDPDDDQKWQFMIDPEFGIGYIRVLSFQENTVEDFAKTIDALARRNLRGLILDLRFNPGGLLKSAVQFSELFLGQGETIVSTRGLRSAEWKIEARRRGEYSDLPLVVLVNSQSASASEIVAGAIKDHHRGLIVGGRTFGKFSVQNLIQLARSEAHLKLTTARYYLPSGRSLHRDDDSLVWGVEPDIDIPLVSKETVKILGGLRERDIIGARVEDVPDEARSEEQAESGGQPRGDTQDDAEGSSPGGTAADQDSPNAASEDRDQPGGDAAEVDRNDRPDIDPQLDAALLVLRTHLLDLSSRIIARGSDPGPTVRSD